MNIGISAGGTLGHIMPGLILAKELAKKHNIIFISSLKDKKYQVLYDAKYIKHIYYVESQGFGKNIIYNIKTIKKVFKASKKIKAVLKEEKIDLVIGMGGYISGITINIANKLKIKTIIHEQNQIIGLANKLVLKKSNKILLSFKSKIPLKYQKKTFIVSNPRLFVQKPENIKKRSNQILITSGSNGAKFINELAIKICNNQSFNDYKIILITGKKYYNLTKEQIKNSNVKVIEFVDNLLPYIYSSSIAIIRAGSSTIFETIAMETIPIIIPSLNVKNNHQYFNANEISNLKLGEIVLEDDNALENLKNQIKSINNNKNTYISNIKKYKSKYHLKRIIDLIEEEGL